MAGTIPKLGFKRISLWKATFCTYGVKAKSPLLRVESLSDALLLLTFVCHAASEGKLKLEEAFQGGRGGGTCFTLSTLLQCLFCERNKNLKTFPPRVQLLLVAVPQVVKPVEIEKIHQLLIMMTMMNMTMTMIMIMMMMTMMTMMMTRTTNTLEAAAAAH